MRLSRLQVLILTYLDNAGGSIQDESNFESWIRNRHPFSDRKVVSKAIMELGLEGYLLIDHDMVIRLTTQGEDKLKSFNVETLSDFEGVPDIDPKDINRN